MRLLKYLLILLMICANANAFYGWVSGYWDENECEICGKTIYYWQEGYSVWSGDSVSWDGTYRSYQKDQQVSMGFDKSISVCQECYDKHHSEYHQLLLDTHTKWLEQKQQENSQLRIKNKEERHLLEIKEKEEKIEKLKKDIEEIRELK